MRSGERGSAVVAGDWTATLVDTAGRGTTYHKNITI